MIWLRQRRTERSNATASHHPAHKSNAEDPSNYPAATVPCALPKPDISPDFRRTSDEDYDPCRVRRAGAGRECRFRARLCRCEGADVWTEVGRDAAGGARERPGAGIRAIGDHPHDAPREGRARAIAPAQTRRLSSAAAEFVLHRTAKADITHRYQDERAGGARS